MDALSPIALATSTHASVWNVLIVRLLFRFGAYNIKILVIDIKGSLSVYLQ